MPTTIVVACDKNGLISSQGRIPWHIPADLKLFRELTENHVVIMGRKTWESLSPKNRPLKDRVNVVVSRHASTFAGSFPLSYWINSVEKAIQFGQYYSNEIFIIGGGEIYTEALSQDLIDRIILTWVDGEYPPIPPCVYFPCKLPPVWNITNTTAYEGFTVKVYEKR